MTHRVKQIVELTPIDPTKEEYWFSESGFSAWNHPSPPMNWSGRSDEVDHHAPSVKGVVPPAPDKAAGNGVEGGGD